MQTLEEIKKDMDAVRVEKRNSFGIWVLSEAYKRRMKSEMSEGTKQMARFLATAY